MSPYIPAADPKIRLYSVLADSGRKSSKEEKQNANQKKFMNHEVGRNIAG